MSTKRANWWPATAEFLSGHVLGDKARVEGEGRNGSKGPYRIDFYLVREEGAWKILDATIRS